MTTACAGTLSGGVGYLAPMDESAFRRLGMLQSALLSAIPHTAGLHPQAYRALRRERLLRNRKVHTHPHLHALLDRLDHSLAVHLCGCMIKLQLQQHTILDGLLLSRYLALDSATQQQIALKLGTSRERILNDLQGIPQSVTHTL
jgi:CRP-like cAMP-binding protein